jgi:hypothetical protein
VRKIALAIKLDTPGARLVEWGLNFNLEVSEMKKAVIFLFILGFSISLGAESDSYMCSMAKSTLKSINVNVKDIKIADGKAKGGERALIITFITNLKAGEQLVELVKILEMGHVLNNKMNARLDTVTAIAGNILGKSRGIINVKVKDVTWFMRTKDSRGYLKRWTVAIMDESYLPDATREMGW